MSTRPNSRLNIVLPQRSIERLEALKVRTDAASLSEVIRNALMTYESLVSHIEDGNVFHCTTPKGDTWAVEFMIDAPGRARLAVVG